MEGIIDVRDHNMTVEKVRIDTLGKYVDNDISSISQSLNELNNYWKDEKSASHITKLTEALEEVKKANESAKTATYDYLEEIGKILKMNYKA